MASLPGCTVKGRNFESEVIKELCSIANIDKSRTTPYHPMGNGMPEKFNQTLLSMLGTLEDDQKSGRPSCLLWSMHTIQRAMKVLGARHIF